ETDSLAAQHPGETWPNIGYVYWRVDVPEWATHALIAYTWGGVNTNGNVHGWTDVRLTNNDQSVKVQTPGTRINTDGVNPGRQTVYNASEIEIPAALRGYEGARIFGHGYRTGGDG